MERLKCLWCGYEFPGDPKCYYRFCDRCAGLLETVEDLVHKTFGTRINIIRMMERRLLNESNKNNLTRRAQ